MIWLCWVMLTAVSACWGFVIQILCYVMVGYTDKSVITCRAVSPNQNAISLQCNKSSWLYLHGLLFMVIRDIPYWCLFLCYSEPKYLNELIMWESVDLMSPQWVSLKYAGSSSLSPNINYCRTWIVIKRSYVMTVAKIKSLARNSTAWEELKA